MAVAGKSTKLEETLASLSRCMQPADYVATVVVENGSKYDAEQIVRKYSDSLNTYYLYHPKGNKSNALNFAIEHIKEEDALLLMTDDDAEFDPNVLNHYAAYARKYPEKAYFGGKMLAKYEHFPPDWLLPILPTSSSNWPTPDLDMMQQHRFLGINWGAYLNDLQKAGGFDVRFGPGTVPRRVGQEHNMQDRLFAEGVRPVFVPEAIVWHYVPKERSSVKFALERTYQFGIRQGILMKSNQQGVVSLLLVTSKYWIKSIGRILLSIITFSKKRRYLGMAEAYTGAGIVKGFFLYQT
jgi:GT2 family glycosyltransferase